VVRLSRPNSRSKSARYSLPFMSPPRPAMTVLVRRVQVDRAKVLSNTIKQKRKEKAGKWEVPLPKV